MEGRCRIDSKQSPQQLRYLHGNLAIGTLLLQCTGTWIKKSTRPGWTWDLFISGRPQVPYHAGNKTYPVNSAKASVGVRILVVDIACPPPHSLSKMIWDTSTCGHSCSTNSEALAGWGQSMLAATKVLSLEY